MKVSIITTTYNSVDSIEETIKSVMSQDYKNIEYIIVDGNSQDGTMNIINLYSSYFDFVISEHDNGPYDAFNKGIKKSTGEIVGFLHSGDTYTSPSVISDLVHVLMEQGKDAVYGDLNYISNNIPKKVIRYWKAGIYNRSNFLYGWMPPHPALYIKRFVYEKYGYYNESFSTAADYELIIRLFYKNRVSCAYLPKVVINMRIGGISNISLTNRIKAHIQDWKAWIKNDISNFPIWVTLKPIRKIYQYYLSK